METIKAEPRDRAEGVIRARRNDSLKFPSPIRYPGGKARLARRLVEHFPSFRTYREPFLGGGSVFFRLKIEKLGGEWELSDSNGMLVNFWKHVQAQPEALIEEIQALKAKHSDGRDLFDVVKNPGESGLADAAGYFIRNRISFSGNHSSGGFSLLSFETRFSDRSISKIRQAAEFLKDTKVSKADYSQALLRSGDNVFLFLDPPYFSNPTSRLYGKNGNLHKTFDHERFVSTLMESSHEWLVTYDDCAEVRDLFSQNKDIHIEPISLYYPSTNSGARGTKFGEEIIVSNYGRSRQWA